MPTTGVQVCPAECAAGSKRGDSLATLGAESGMHETTMTRLGLAPINEFAGTTKKPQITTLWARA